MDVEDCDVMKLDKYHYHEMADRLDMVTSIIDSHLYDHPVAHKHEEVGEIINKVIEDLGEAYQLIGRMNYDTTT